MIQSSSRSKQKGIALIALLALIILAGGYAFYRSANVSTVRIQQQGQLLAQLAKAKEALIAYAAIDSKRPGRLLCPDIIGNGISPTLARDDCNNYPDWKQGDIYAGWLPGKTLDLTETVDGYGSNFRYYVSPLFGGDRKTPQLNSDTPTQLHLDVPTGAASNDIAAVIIATRGPLDTRNADGDDYFYSGTSNSPDDNDVIIAITRQELMAAVEQRIANEIRSCLEQHVTSTDNPQHTYPWPAPLANNIFKGVVNSLFGMVPKTQPGNPEIKLKEAFTKLSNIEISSNLPLTAEEAKSQLTILEQLQQVAAYSRALFDRLYIVALALNNSAIQASKDFNLLNSTLSSATTSKPIVTATASTLPELIAGGLPSLTGFQEALANSGFDIFLTELQIQNLSLKNALDAARIASNTSTLNTLLTSVNEFNHRLLNYASTPNGDIEPQIKTAFDASTHAAESINTAKTKLDEASIKTALTDAQTLYDKNERISTTILSLREISYVVEQISTLQRTLAQNPSSQNASTLASALTSARTLLNPLNVTTIMMANARSASLTALDIALAAAKPDGDLTLIQTSTTNAAIALNTLTTSLNDNVALETLKSITVSLYSATMEIPATNAAVDLLRKQQVKAVIYWSNVAISQSDKIATLARKGIKNDGTPTIDDSDTSAYTTARKLLASLDGETGSIALLAKSAKNLNDAELQKKTGEAVSATQRLLTTLLEATTDLDTILNSGEADAAVPTIWNGDACAFVKPPTGSDTWWGANNWSSFTFYQISNRIRPQTGILSVNGSGNYRTVTMATGKAIVGQVRSVRETQNFLEGKNANSTRNGNAQSPATQFSSGALSPTFNDHLSY